MRADLTNPNKMAYRYLQSRGAAGIPFNEVYGPGAIDGMILPVILSSGAVRNAIYQADSLSKK